MAKSDLEKDRKFWNNKFYGIGVGLLSKFFGREVASLLIIFLVPFCLSITWKVMFNNKTEASQKMISSSSNISDSQVMNINGDNNTVVLSNEVLGLEIDSEKNDWVPFTGEYWIGLNKGFVVVNGVYSLPEHKRETDSLATFRETFTGDVTAEFIFVPLSSKGINLNIYYDSWFRWEIGGNDLNSIRLYKNRDGCQQSQTKNVRRVRLEKEHFSARNSLKLNSPVTATMSGIVTEFGKLQTKIVLGYISLKSDEYVVEDGYYYEFDISDNCDGNSVVIDPNIDHQVIKIGMQKSTTESAELPKVRFEEFRLTQLP